MSYSPLRDYLRKMAGWVWNEQAHAFRHRLTLNEETLTEMLLLRMARDYDKHGLKVRIFNKPEEKRNGADWEWIIKTPTCDISFRVQAKRLYCSDTKKEYGGLSLKSKQVDNLILKAGTSIPVYVFYNHDLGINSQLLTAGGEAGYYGRSYWGCSIASAQRVKKANSNKLSALSKIMKPWHRLVDSAGKCSASGALGVSQADIDRSMPPDRRDVVERLEDREFMLNYTKREELAGVAVMDFSQFRRG